MNEAAALLDQALKLQKKGELLQAELIYVNILSATPKHADALHLLGVVQLQKKNYDKAIEFIEQAVQIKPEAAPYHSNLGIAFRKNGNLDRAQTCYLHALQLDPTYVDAQYNLGIVLQELQDYDAALAAYQKTISLDKLYFKAYSNIGNIYRIFRDFEKALKFHHEAIQLNPNNAEAYSNAGVCLDNLQQHAEAQKFFSKAIELKPNFDTALVNLGNSLRYQKKYEEAVVYYQLAMALNPDYEYLYGALINTQLQICDWRTYKEDIQRIEGNFKNLSHAISSFTSLTLSDNESHHLYFAQSWQKTKFKKDRSLGPIPKRTRHGKIKLGFYSADFWFNPVSLWLAEQVERHDKNKFELYAFNFNPKARDPMTLRLEAAFDHMIPVDTMPDTEVAKFSRELEIDIALDLGGHTHGSRPGIFAARAAPIQISHLGNPGTTGSDYIDYLITDKHAVPESSQAYYTEKMLYVPCQYTYDTKRQLSTKPQSRADFGLPENGFIFTCQNSIYKIRPDYFDIWMRLLKQVPGSVLWLMQQNATALVNLQMEAKARGVDPQRLVFTKRETVTADKEYERIGRYLASYKLADLFLDTLPYNAGTTAIDALWAGLPVLTQTGQAQVGRMAASALNAIEMPELITKSAEEYEALALELALNSEKLKQIKEKLEKKILSSAIFDIESNVHHLENVMSYAYKNMFHS